MALTDEDASMVDRFSQPKLKYLTKKTNSYLDELSL